MGNKKSTIRMLPTPAGPYSVGCVDILHDYSLDGVFLRLFYPVAKCDISNHAAQLMPWIPRPEYLDGYASYVKIPAAVVRFFYNCALGGLFIPALKNAALINKSEAERLPVLIFSHGLAANRSTYNTICCDMASQGFIVAAVEHRDGSASHSYCLKKAEGGAIELIEEPIRYRRIAQGEKEFPVRHAQIKIRVEECKKALNVLKAADKGEPVRNLLPEFMDMNCFKDRMDFGRVGIMGHSFGGATVIAAVANDQDYKAGVVLDGWMFPLHNDMMSVDIKQPLLFINMDEFQWRDNILRMKRFDSKTVDRLMYTIKGSVHQSQTDSTFILSGWIAKKSHARGEIDPRLCNDINNELSLAFLRKHLALESNSTIDDVVRHYENWIVVGTNVNLGATQSSL